MLVHVDRGELPVDLVYIEIDVPDGLDIGCVEIKSLPEQWRDCPGPEALRQIGDEWLRQREVPLLQVPSAVIPEESNYLLNPAHPQAGALSVISMGDFLFDPGCHRGVFPAHRPAGSNPSFSQSPKRKSLIAKSPRPSRPCL
jgi:RES domain-containing protein